MIVWYSLIIIMIGGVILSKKVLDEWGIFNSFLMWILVGFIGLGLLGGTLVSDLSSQEVAVEDKYVLEDFSNYYAVYEKDTYLVIQDNGNLLVRLKNKNGKITEKIYSNYSIKFVDEEIEPTTIESLKDSKNKVLKHLFWNFNAWKYEVIVPVGTEIVYKR